MVPTHFKHGSKVIQMPANRLWPFFFDENGYWKVRSLIRKNIKYLKKRNKLTE